MSIVRIGLAETKNFSDGYDRIFGKKEAPEAKKVEAPEAKPSEENKNTTPKAEQET